MIRSLKKGHDEIANLLLDNGAMVDVPLVRYPWGDVVPKTCALHEAVRRNKYDIVKKIISQGANLNVELDNKTALGIALGGKYTEIAKLLIDNGADYSDVGIWHEHKYTPILDYVLERPSDPDRLLIFEAMKRKKEEEKKEDRYTSLISAIGEKDKRRVLQILWDIQDVNIIDKKTGSLALTEAIRVGDFELVKLLVNEYNADVNKKDGSGYTPISLARSRKEKNIKKFLIDHGAECNLYEKGWDLCTKAGGIFLGSCWYIVCSLGLVCGSILWSVYIVQCVKKHGIKRGIKYAIKDYKEMFNNYMQILPAPVAYFCRKSEILVKLLLNGGFSPNKTLDGESPLMIILKRCDYKSWTADTKYEFDHIQDLLSRNVELLIKCGADVNYGNKTCGFPLEKAIQYGFFATAKFLVQKGADVNCHSGDTPLMIAAEGRNYDMVIFLILNGANFEYSDIPNLFKDNMLGVPGGIEAGILCAIYNEDKDKLNKMFNYYKYRHGYLHENWKDVLSLVGRSEPPTSFMYVLEKYVLPNVQDEQIKDTLKNFMCEKETKVNGISREHDNKSPLYISKVEALEKAGPSIAI